MRRTKRAYVPALFIMAIVGLVLALCLPVGAFADSTAAAEASVSTSSSTTESGASSATGTTLTTGETGGPTGSDTGASESSASSASEDSATTATTLLSNGAASSSEPSGAQGLLAALQADEATAVAAASTDATVTEKIYYDTTTGIHSVYSTPNDTSSTRIILYCMNNQAHWPHATNEIPTVPDYTQGYLTEASFTSKEEYEACMHKLEAILYAGYNYNGLNLYKVVSGTPRATLQEFNDALQAPDNLRSDYPTILGDTVFTYENSKDSSSENYQKLVEFMQQVFSLYFTGGTTASGLTYNDIIATKFYKAVYALINSEDPFVTYASQASDYYVTEQGAYDATQNAIWVTLASYGVPNNDMTREAAVSVTPLTATLLDSADYSKLLRQEPQDSQTSITSSDAKFTYDPATKTWRTGVLTLSEGANYNGEYALTLPSGVTAYSDALGTATAVSTVSAGEQFYLVSSTKPTSSVTVTASDALTWIEETRQYSPDPETYTAPDGKSFQHMIGAVIKQKTVKASLEAAPASDGDLTVSKTVKGETNSQTDFTFTVTLDNTSINGTYGDMTFTNGVATITLKGGQSATAKYLPGGTGYTVTETSNSDYAASSSTLAGTVPSDGTAATAAFTNTSLYKLTLSKTVSGQAASTSQQFTMRITLKDASGNPLSGTYSYTGGTVSGSSATVPASGTITLDANGTGSVQLSAGQQVTIAGIPSGTTYAVEEVTSTAEDALLYDVTYNGNTTAATGALTADATVAVTNAVQEGSLSVTKHVKGEVGSTQAFTFTVKLGGSGATLSGQYGDMLFSNGQATFTPKDGETKTASALPAGATYEVIEESNDKYATTSENATGTIAKGATARVSFTNTRGMTTLPLSGGAGFGATYAIGLGALVAAALWMHVRRHAAGKGGDGRD